MSVMNRNSPLATSAAAPPSLLTQVGMAGTSAVITVSLETALLFLRPERFFDKYKTTTFD